MGRGFGQGPMMGRGSGQGPMMGRGSGQGQGPMMGRGQGQGPMMQGRRPEAMPEGRGQQRREAMPEQGRREGRMTEGPQAKVVTPSLHGQLPGRVARLLEPGVIEKLRLSDEQRDRIHRLMAEYREQITNMSQRVASAIRDIPAGQRVGKAAEVVGNARKHAQSLTRELIDKATDVLTPRQRAAVEKLLDAVDKMGKAPKSREKEYGDDDKKDDDDR
jgi:Spy/CpxP family protein refolding chaperone